MKKIGLGLLAILVVLVAAVLIAPGFIDWNAYKDRIAAEVRDATGRELAIDGDIGLTLLPSPAFSVEDARLANAPGGSDPTMVALRSLKVRVALLPLLQGRIQVDRVALVEPKILLEVLPDGRGNWFLADNTAEGGVATRDSTGGGTGPVGRIALESVTISGGTVIYRDAKSGRDERIDDLNAEVAAESLKGPFAARGEAKVRGIAVAFDMSAGRLPTEGASPLAMLLRLPEQQAELQFNGAFSSHPDGNSLRGRIKASGDNLAAISRAMAGFDTPALFAKPFLLESEVSLAAQRMAATAISFRQGDMAIEGSAQLTPGSPSDIQITLSAQHIDLDKALTELAAAETGDTDTTASSEAPAADAGASTSPGVVAPIIPTDMSGSLQLALDAVVYRSQVIRQVLVNAELAGGRVKLSQAIALLPGGSDVTLTGALAAGPGSSPRFTGRIEAASDNLRAVLEWLGTDMAAVPAERLRRMTLSGDIEATTDQLTLDKVDLRVDVSRATGGIAVALRDRPAYGIGLAVDKLNLDAYLPQGIPGVGAGPDAPADAATANGQDAPPRDTMAVVDSIDANLDLRLGNLTARGVSARDLHVDLTMQRGSMVIREASVADFAGSSLRLSGAAAALSTAPTFDGEVELNVPEPVRLAKAFGVASEPLARLGAVEVAGMVKGSAQDVALDVEVSAAGGRLGLKGTVQPAAVANFDVAVTATHPDVAKLARTLAKDARLAQGLGGIDIAARLTGSAEQFNVTDLAGQIGPTEVSGTLSADLSGAKPALTADLVTSELPMAALLAPAAGGQGGAARPGGVGTGAAKDGRWSSEPINVAAMNAVDADLKLRAQALTTDSLRIDKATVEANLKDGILDVRELNGTFYDGALSITGKIVAKESIQAGLAVTAIEMDVGRLLQDMAETDRISGPLTLNASLTTEGKSEAELVRALAGNGDLNGTLTVERKAEEQLSAVLLGVLGEKVKEIRGITDATNVLFNAFAGTPATLAGTFTVDKGIVRTGDTKLDGNQATALTEGTIDLPAWQIDTRTNVFRAENPDTPYLTAELRGPLNKPNPRISGQPFQRRQQPAPTEPPPAAPGAAPPAPSGPAPVKPEDIIKKGLEGLLKGLNQ